MAKFLIAVWPFAGHYFPTIAVANALRERGHDPLFYTGTQAIPVIEKAGFACSPFQRIDEEHVHRIMFTRETYASRRQPRQLQALLRDWLLGTVLGQVTDIQEIIDHWRPDVVLAETSMLGPMLILHENQSVPVAVFSTVIACLLPGSNAPPFGLGLPRPHNWLTRLLANGVQVVSDRLGAGFRQEANCLRGRYGLPPLSVSVTAYTGQMPLYIVPGVKEFDYNRQDLPASVHYVGPCIWNNPGEEPIPTWLQKLPNGRPLIHVSEGTLHTERPLLLQTAVAALSHLPIDLIITTGGNRSPEEMELGPLPPNVRVERWVSHRHLMPKTDLLITTGGAGTVMAALTNGVPMVIVPTDWDKPENAQRVAEAGVGIRLPLPRCTPYRLRTTVQQVLENPSYAQNAARFSQLLRQYNGPEQTAELLEALAAATLQLEPTTRYAANPMPENI